MSVNVSVITAIIKKDARSLLPLVLIAAAVFLIVPLVANLDLVSMGGDTEFWLMLQANIYWIGFVLGAMLMISVLQLDSADSRTHDWLSRPIGRIDFILAKFGFMLLFIVLPVVLSRVLVNLSMGLSPILSLSFAAGIQELDTVLFVPLLFATALLTPSLRKLILLLVLVFFIFLLPGWSVTKPILAAIGISLATEFDGMMWVQGALFVMFSSLGGMAIYWFLYVKRKTMPTYIAFWVMVAALFFTVYPPESVYNWDRAIAFNAALLNSTDESLIDQVTLEKATVCYPAAYVDDVNATEQENRLLAEAGWPAAYLENLEAGAMTLATATRYRETLTGWFAPASEDREFSVPWRFDRIRSRAYFMADSLKERVELTRSPAAANRFSPISAIETDYWMVPQSLLQKLDGDSSVQLMIEIDGSVLSPTSYELPTDGERYDFSLLGSCKADLDPIDNKINVECLKRGVRPELVSAQLIGINSSRVDSGSRASYTGDFIESMALKRYELTVPMPSLADSSSIMLTAFNAEQLISQKLIVPGMLGDNLSICPLPDSAEDAVLPSSSWSDRSPHEVSSVAVDRGVRLEVLDWRRDVDVAAPTLLLIPGLGATAHSFDDLASQLSNRYNVIAMTRRGTGISGKPDRGYGIERLGQDVLQVLDSLGVQTAVLVGHSLGGEELSYLGANHPERVDGLIYLDAAYDRVSLASAEDNRMRREYSVALPQRPPPRPNEGLSYAAMEGYTRRLGIGRNVPEGEIIASYDLTTGSIKHDELYLDALMRGIQAPNYEAIKAPALALYALASSPDSMMETWYDSNDTELRMAVDGLFEIDNARKLAQISRFEAGITHAEVIALEDADHWIFLSHPEEVLTAIHRFMQGIDFASQ